MTYNFLSVRSPEDEKDPFFPQVLNKGKSVVTHPALDGQNIETFFCWHVRVSELLDGKYEDLGSFGVGTSVQTIFLTDVRLIFIDPKFEMPKSGYLLWDMPNFYLASAAIAKLKTHNRALTGHVPLPCIYRVEAQPADRRTKSSSLVRMYMADASESDQPVRQLRLSFFTKRDVDPFHVASR